MLFSGVIPEPVFTFLPGTSDKKLLEQQPERYVGGVVRYHGATLCKAMMGNRKVKAMNGQGSSGDQTAAIFLPFDCRNHCDKLVFPEMMAFIP